MNITVKECLDFAIYFNANWEFYDSVWQGELYEHKTTKQVLLINEIFDSWQLAMYSEWIKTSI